MGQQAVPNFVPQGVVDVLEVVQVQKQHRQRCVAALRLCNRLLTALGQQRAIGQASERVVMGQPIDVLPVVFALLDFFVQILGRIDQRMGAFRDHPLQFGMGLAQGFLGLAALGNVHKNPDRAAIVQGLAAGLANQLGSILAAQVQLSGKHFAHRQRGGVIGQLRSPVAVAGKPVPRRLAAQLPWGVPQHLLGMPIALHHLVLAHIHHPHHGVIEQDLGLQLNSIKL